jgi:hypothetical protein
MTFFNRKEEVIELELTRIGRQKLSIGEFKPAYYEFLDEDVLYDKKNYSTNSSEEQNQIKNRIKQKLTLRSETAKQSVPGKGQVYKEENRLIQSLGTFTPYSNYKPSWNIVAEEGVVFTGSGEVSYTPLEVSEGLTIGPTYEKIPQLSLVCQYDYNLILSPYGKDDINLINAVIENPNLSIEDVFKGENDNTSILFKRDFNDFTISFEEENVLSGKEEYMIEVFKYDYNQDGKIVKTKLYFDQETVDENSVYWYFNIKKDVNAIVDNFTYVDEPNKVEGVDDECVSL